jgi:hypothetical protein
MRTTIHFKDGHSESYDDCGPNIYEGMLSLVYPDCSTVGDDVPITEVKQVIFDNTDPQV